MSRTSENQMLRNAMLFSAFAAGLILTQFVPAYEEVASAPEQHPRATASSHDTASRDTKDVTRIDG
jgi:hypothetical protein